MSSKLSAIALASQSPRRRQLLETLGLQVTVVRSGFDEDAQPWDRDAAALALDFARRKAAQADPTGPPILVAADTIVVVDADILGKPKDAPDAIRMLQKLSGRQHVVHTGYAVVDRSRQQHREGVESTRVDFLPLSDAQIAGYVASGDPLDKAGAYGIQGRGGLLISSIQGDFYAVMGLPLARLGQALTQLGYDLLAQ